ncbi:hypothetical protein AVEN_224808-1 [Araneus ventricosus]|uniref:Uncharacterized protein n=1 Tax=Araneus ventricosus TaxID=182803 RepID=A0A4Y2FXJ1_ARAVE|nr:hypothetical protein AVEN_224808-1 [Araneus ventricosus]
MPSHSLIRIYERLSFVASSKIIVAFLLEPSVRLQGREPNVRILAPRPRRRTTSVHRVRQANSTHTKKNLPVRGRPELITPKSFRRLNGEHIVRCKKKDLKLIKHRTIKKLHEKLK